MSFSHKHVVGDFKLEKLPDQIIGEGAFGEVLAIEGDDKHAFKVFQSSNIYHAVEIAESAFREYIETIKTLKSIRHKNVIKIIAAFIIEEDENDFRFLLVMKLYEHNLFEYLHHKGCGMHLEKLRNFALQITCGLSALRDRQLYFLDLKPENIMVSNKGHTFKIAEVDSLKIHAHMIFRFKRDVIESKHEYMAPELKRALASVTANQLGRFKTLFIAEKCNMFSLALIFYKCLYPNRDVTLGLVRQAMDRNTSSSMIELTSLMRSMLQEISNQRASLDSVCFSGFFLHSFLPVSVKVIGAVEHYQQHNNLISPSTSQHNTTDLNRESSIKRPDRPYVVTCRKNVVRLRSIENVYGWEKCDRLIEFVETSSTHKQAERNVFLFTGTNAEKSEEIIGYNKTALTDCRYCDDTFIEKDTAYLKESLLGTNINNINVINLGKHTNDFFGLCKRLHQLNLKESDILVMSFCHAANSDVLKVVQSYINQKMLLQHVEDLKKSMSRIKVINISGSIINNFRKKQRFLWDHQMLAKSHLPAEQLSCIETQHIDAANYKGLIRNIGKDEPNVLLLSFSIGGNISLTSYLNSLLSKKASERCSIQ